MIVMEQKEENLESSLKPWITMIMVLYPPNFLENSKRKCDF